MKFAHMADAHIGAWRDPKLKDLSMDSFKRAIDFSVKEKVDFILISGDLFNTSMPGIDYLKETTKKLKELAEKNIPAYIIPGSHDQSPSGKTMLDVLEEAGLVINVVKGKVEGERLKLNFTVDKRTGTKITGLLGRRGMLDRRYYEQLDIESLEKEPGKKIFMFHTSITELKPKEMEKMESAPVSFLPKGFEYYAGGHVHIVRDETIEGYKHVVYPGPLFPANFAELESLGCGSFCIYDDGIIKNVKIETVKTCNINIDAEHKKPQDIEKDIYDKTANQDFTDTIILIRIQGKLKNGRPGDIDFRTIIDQLHQQGAFFVMKSTSKLTSEEFEEIKSDNLTSEEIESKIIKDHLGQIKVSFTTTEESLTKDLMRAFAMEKDEGEKVYEYEERVKQEIDKIINT